MISSVLSLVLLVSIPLAAAQASYISHGCVAPAIFTGATIQASGAASVAACNSVCTTKYFFYREGNPTATDRCQCTDTDPYRGNAAFVSGLYNGAWTCPTDTFSAWMRQTTFEFGGCYDTTAPPGALQIYLAASLDTITNYCRGQRTVGFSLDPSSRTYNGFCGGVGTNVPGSPVACSENSRRYYTHNAAAAASQLARRQARLSRRKAKTPEYCPAPMLACNVEGVPGAYECLDVASELESCGGCAFGTFGGNSTASGQDCSTMSGARPRSVTCAEGRCVAMACIKGHSLIGGECVKR